MWFLRYTGAETAIKELIKLVGYKEPLSFIVILFVKCELEQFPTFIPGHEFTNIFTMQSATDLRTCRLNA